MIGSHAAWTEVVTAYSHIQNHIMYCQDKCQDKLTAFEI